MVANHKLTGCWVAAIFVAGAAGAQDAPSWRALQETPSRPELPPEIERPEIEFSVSRDELIGFGMEPATTAAVASEPDAPVEPEPIASGPDPIPAPTGPDDPAPADLDASASSFAAAGDEEADPLPATTVPLGFAADRSEADTAVEQEPEDLSDQEPMAVEQDLVLLPIGADGPVDDAAADQLPSTAQPLGLAPDESQVDEPPIAAASDQEPVELSIDPEAALAYADSGLAPAAVESHDERAPVVESNPRDWSAEPADSDRFGAAARSSSPRPEDPFEEAPGEDPNSSYRLIRKRTVEPDYPRKAYRDGVEGWVNLRVTVAPSGLVEAVEVLDAQPRRVFDVSAMRAVRKWRFEPPSLAGLTTPQSGVYRISFTMQ